MSQPLKQYLREGKREMLMRQLSEMENAQRAARRQVDWLKTNLFQTIVVSGFKDITERVQNFSLREISNCIDAVKRLGVDELHSSSWKTVERKVDDLYKLLVKIDQRTDRAKTEEDVKDLLSFWNDYTIDYKYMVEDFVEAVNDYEQAIQRFEA